LLNTDPTQVVRTLGGPDGGKLEMQANWIGYPDSQYDNLRDGFPNEKV
jgi:chitinase